MDGWLWLERAGACAVGLGLGRCSHVRARSHWSTSDVTTRGPTGRPVRGKRQGRDATDPHHPLLHPARAS